MPDLDPKPNTSTLLYLCGVASSINRSTSAFVNRGLTQYTVGRLSQIQAIGKPTELQFAFSGYKGSIEHFVAATANKTKYLTSAEEVPLPDGYIPSVPLPLPALVFRVGAAIKGPLFKKLTEKLTAEGLNQADVGGEAGTAFELMRPSWNTVYNIGVKAFNRNCARLDGRAQFGDLLLFKPIYQFIDAFLATNTYPYKEDRYALFHFVFVSMSVERM